LPSMTRRTSDEPTAAAVPAEESKETPCSEGVSRTSSINSKGMKQNADQESKEIACSEGVSRTSSINLAGTKRNLDQESKETTCSEGVSRTSSINLAGTKRNLDQSQPPTAAVADPVQPCSGGEPAADVTADTPQPNSGGTEMGAATPPCGVPAKQNHRMSGWYRLKSMTPRPSEGGQENIRRLVNRRWDQNDQAPVPTGANHGHKAREGPSSMAKMAQRYSMAKVARPSSVAQVACPSSVAKVAPLRPPSTQSSKPSTEPRMMQPSMPESKKQSKPLWWRSHTWQGVPLKDSADSGAIEAMQPMYLSSDEAVMGCSSSCSPRGGSGDRSGVGVAKTRGSMPAMPRRQGARRRHTARATQAWTATSTKPSTISALEQSSLKNGTGRCGHPPLLMAVSLVVNPDPMVSPVAILMRKLLGSLVRNLYTGHALNPGARGAAPSPTLYPSSPPPCLVLVRVEPAKP